ncbi:MAG: hypothetical protein PHT44_01930 [Candidatus Portnoybacteria bacterium]|nr:hypothetical protein [Candidatus Portnoybacteria bacterium]MDD4982647.1 hypothetical protein [Candidatus Portnoybacteria bacterium]
MKKRIWIKVDALRLSHLFLGKEKESAWGSVEVGRDGFTMHSFVFTKKPNGDFSQNTTGANIRLLDVPIIHKLKHRPTPKALLEDVLCLAVADEYLVARKDELSTFIKSVERPNLPWFTPSSWPGSLRIPVDFIRLFNFKCHEDGPAYADIQIGHHLVFWYVSVYDRRDRNPFRQSKYYKDIRDKQVLRAIDRLLTRKKVRAYLEKLTLNHHAIPDEIEFIDTVPGCQPKGLPPRIRFY